MGRAGADDRDVVIVMTDQHRAGASAREGFALDTTPYLDSLARDGVWFDRAYTTSPLCCPARTSLMTGRWPSAHRVTQNPASAMAVFHTDLFGVARADGRATALIGKNHTYLTADDVDAFVDYTHDGSVDRPDEPTSAAFDDWLAALRHRTAEEPTPFPVEAQNPHRIVDAALEWVSGVDMDRPLALVVSFPEPHNPYQVPEPYFDLFPPESLPPVTAGAEALDSLPYAWRHLQRIGREAFPDYDAVVSRARSNYYGMLRLIDDEVRRLDAGLRERRGSRPRVLIMTADHGDLVGDYGLVRKGAEIPDVLARIPLLVHGEGIGPRSSAHPAHVSIADLMPTLCEAMGAGLPPGVQGRSLWPLLVGEDYPDAEFASAYTEQGMGGLPYSESDADAAGLPGLIHDGPDGAPRFDELNAVTQSGRRRKIRAGDWSLQVDVLGSARLHHLPSDPLELDDRWDDPSPAAIGAKVELLRQLAVWQLRAEDTLPVVADGYPLKTDPRNWVAPLASDH